MGTVYPFSLEKLVVGVLTSDPELKSSVEEALEGLFGPIDYRSSSYGFLHTHYYDAEMGTPLTRFFLSFENLVDPGRLGEIKLQTNRLEDRFRMKGKRKVNLDPGLLSLSRFILASTKNSSHRIPLASGIYAEVTLVYEAGRFRPLEWTYPDYRSEEYRKVLAEIRSCYKRQIQRLTA